MSIELFVGHAKPPANTGTDQAFGVITIVLEVDCDTGEIRDADVMMQSPVESRFLAELLTGRNLASDFVSIVGAIEREYHAPSQKAVTQALNEAAKRYSAAATQRSRCSGLNIAFFSMGSDNAYLKSGIEAAKDAAGRFGASLNVFDARFDVSVQLGQMECALQNGQYDALVVESLESSSATRALGKALNEDRVPVSVMNTPLGSRDLKSGADLWQPETITFVGGQTHDTYETWLQQIVRDFRELRPTGGEAAIITGPRICANSRNFDDVVRTLIPGSGIRVVAFRETEYRTDQAYCEAVDIIEEHPTVNCFISNYSGMSQGIVRALAEAGIDGRVKVYDFGGSAWALNAVRRGDIALTAMMLPYTEARLAVEAVGNHVLGKQVPRVVDLASLPSLPGTIIVTQENVERFRAEFA